MQTCALLSGADNYLPKASQLHEKIVTCAASIKLYEVQHYTQLPSSTAAAPDSRA